MSAVRATCIGCGCDDDNACASTADPGHGCHWLRVDYEIGCLGVCSECPDHVGRWDSGDRLPSITFIATQPERQP